MGARDIVNALGGSWLGSYGTARCPAHYDRNPSLSIREQNGKVLARCHAGCDQRDVIAALRDNGLWPDPATSDNDRQRIPRNPTSKRVPESSFSRNNEMACDIWRASIPLWDPRAEPGRLYLDSRGLPWPYPETIAYGELSHPETHEIVPTLIVARHCPKVGMVRGIQRIFLTPDGRKYPHGIVKMSLGSIEGGRAELIHPRPLTDLVIAEGVESALSAHRIFNLPAWATCGGFPSELSLPDSVRAITIVADHDASGISVARAKQLASSLRMEGRYVKVLCPEKVGLDANDLLKGAA